MKSNRGTPDFLLLILTISIVGFGIVMVYSSSFTISYWDMGTKWYFTKRQLIYSGIGLFLMLIAMNLPISFYKKHFLLFLFGSVIMLILVFIPGIGVTLNGASSWIGLNSKNTIQPSEFAKLGLIIYLSAIIAKKKETMRDFKQGLLPCLIVTSVFLILIALQPDYGSAFILAVTAGIIIMVGGTNLKHILYILMISILLVLIIVFTSGNVLSRFTSYLNPWSDPYGDGYQLIQSLIALGNGEIFGVGFGKGIQKYFYLPYPQSDFIFSVMGEELGFIGITIFFIVFLMIIWRIIINALRSKETFGMLLGIGIASLLAIQAAINIGGVTGTIPITGVPLPFISAGGSSLIVSMISIGIILSLSREH